MKTSVMVMSRNGLHAKASARLTKLTSEFPCEIWLTKGERRINGKSIMGVMLLAAGYGSHVEVEALGEREADALLAIAEFFSARFGEDI